MSSLSLTLLGAARQAAEAQVPGLVDHEFASRLAAKDHTLWGPEAEDESAKRLGWVAPFEAARPLVEQITALRAELAAEGVDRVVLAGMGGSSLAPEVITATYGAQLVVLDSTDPQQVSAALTDLERTVLVVSSKSGSTVETDSQRRIVQQAFSSAGISAAARTVVVTDPGSPLGESAREQGVRAVFEADPSVGGRYSALTAFGLVPSGLAGVDIAALLDEAESALDLLTEDDAANPGLQLGAAIGGTSPLRDKLVIADAGSPLVGIGAWIEQLVAESTGKEGTGLLPVIVADGEPELTRDADDVLVVEIVDAEAEDGASVDADPAETVVSPHVVRTGGSLGAQFLLWEFATAVAGSLLGINPFDQPDVESAKVAARSLLGSPAPESGEAVTDGAVEIRASGDESLLTNGQVTVAEAVQALLARVPDTGYVAVMAYLDRTSETELEEIRPQLAALAGRPVTFGWGPRFLHSTGQFHKGGPAVGVFLQITTSAEQDLDVPERPFTLTQLISAQANGDAAVLAEHGRPVLQLHLTDRKAGLQQVIDAVSSLS
ncbi:glucose-6-phosphate isomerase [Nesterenkonia alkaliphila]|uniref:Glucose-6-phosphate isomerase n=1 Tax=Nesterenkonia alkaliphila TaxID=1463631 RepID=A0A7K1UMB2_9MICC|nr:glucose-6-phosphate isomerase [Nesterenkonia alkaliphila]MVT27603.1 glucose-6-phosphate isomerase [Nesterenkonia alkaliphila]GFZ79769.1 glucose-6-phosphate isomerase [Nesterenkonia alkaliphila]